MVAFGGELRQIHLLESPQLKVQIKGLAFDYPVVGNNSVTHKMDESRRERILDHNDVEKYMNIVSSLSLTDTIMQQIDAIDVF